MVNQSFRLNACTANHEMQFAVQGEINSRTLSITIIDKAGIENYISNAESIDRPVNLTGATARLFIVKPDRKKVLVDGEITDEENGKVDFVLPEQATTVAGNAECQILVSLQDGSKLKATGLTLQVQPSDLEDTAESSDEFLSLVVALNKVDPAIERIDKAVSDSEEALKNANEATQSANEAASLANEKVELANTAATNANDKANLADEKAGLAGEKANLANKAADNANKKAELANTAAQNADGKAILANKATDKANTATTNINTVKDNCIIATGKANTATSNANTATGKANTATDRANTAAENAESAIEGQLDPAIDARIKVKTDVDGGVASYEALSSHASNTDIHTSAEEKGNWIVSGRKAGTAVGKKSVALGYNTTASGNYSTAMGDNTTASGYESTAMGRNTTVSGDYGSLTMGDNTIASGNTSTAMGDNTIASGNESTAMGYFTIANEYASTAIGKYNKEMSSGDLFVIGNSDSRPGSNAFRVNNSGQVYGTGSYHSSGADYSEYFEWLDGNPSGEDRVGHFVTLGGEKIKYANENDYIVGIVSATPAIVGDSASENWKKQYKTDIYGRIQYEEKTFPEERDEEVVIRKARTGTVPILSPDYDPEKDYLNREQRKEWAIIGMFGKLIVVDDGSCKVNGYCKPNNGIATAASTGYRVMARLDGNHIKILLK